MTLTHAPKAVVGSAALVALGWRITLIGVATVAVALELTPWVRAPLAIAAAVVTVVFCLRRFSRRSPVDRILTAVGSSVVGLALLGLLLNVLPWGLSAVGWGVGVGVVEVMALIAVTFLRPRPDGERVRLALPSRSGAVWAVLIAAVLAGALTWSVSSFETTHVEPLALAGVPSGDSLKVTISSGTDAGSYDLVRSSGSSRTVLASDVEVGPGSPVTVTIAIHNGVREHIELVRSGDTKPLRELILDTRSSVTKVSK